MKLEEESFYHITAELQKIGEPIGLEFHPFCVGWYNQYLQNKTFALPYPIDTLAFCVISTPKFFESFFLSHMRSVNLQECSQDPFDKCFASVFGNIKEHFRSSDSYEIDVIHDYEVDTRRRPKLLVQTAGHVSGAAYYYQRKDVPDDPWGDRKIYGVSCHPKLGGWFGFRGGLIFKGLEYPLLDMKAPPDVLSREQKIEFLEGYNFHWQEWTFRDVLDTSADKYSQLQKTYFQTKPCERFELLQNYFNTK